MILPVYTMNISNTNLKHVSLHTGYYDLQERNKLALLLAHLICLSNDIGTNNSRKTGGGGEQP